jgi:hypothetical protein
VSPDLGLLGRVARRRVGDQLAQRGQVAAGRLVERGAHLRRGSEQLDGPHAQPGAPSDRLVAGGARRAPAQLVLGALDRRDLPLCDRRDADGPRIRQRVEQRAPDPPQGVGGELQAAAMVEPLDGQQEADGALLHEVLERDAATAVTRGERADQAQVADDHLVLRRSVALLDAPREPGDVGGGQQSVGHGLARVRRPTRGPVATRPAPPRWLAGRRG